MVTGLKEPTAGYTEQPGVGVIKRLPVLKAGKVMEVNPQTGVGVGVGDKTETGSRGFVQDQDNQPKTINNALIIYFFI
jgi:hypothetical protein